MPLARYESIEESLKTRILDVSKQEFAALGYEGASYNKIIQKIGISKGSMYYYFENKEDLFVTCFLNEALAMGTFRIAMASFPLTEDKATYWDSIKDMSSKQWNDVFQHPVLMSLMRQLVSLGTDHPIFHKLNAECEGLSEYGDIMAILKHGVEIGAIRDDVPLDVLIRMNQEYEMWLMQETQEGRVSEHQAINKFLEMFKQLFEARR